MTQSREFAKVLFSTLSLIILAGCTGVDAGKDAKKTVTSKSVASHGDVIEANDKATLEKHINGNKPVILKFSATWCGPCKAIAPAYEKQATEMKDKVVFLAADLDKAGDLAGEYGVMGVPTFLYFKDGEVIKRNVGGNPAFISTDAVNEIFGLK